MATYRKTLSSNQYYEVILNVSQSSQNTANNTSSISWNLQVRKSFGSGFWGLDATASSWKVTIDGTEVSNSGGSYDFRGGAPLTKTIASGTRTITHAGDGSKSIAVSGYWKDNANGLGSATATGTMALSTIPRASTLSAFSFASHLKNGVANKINYTVSRKSGSFRHQIQLRDGSTTVLSWDNVSSDGASEIELTAANVNTLLTRMPTSTTKTFTLRVATRSGNNGGWIGSAVTRTATGTVHADVKPVLSSMTFGIDGSRIDKTINKYVQGYTKVKASVVRTAGYASSIKQTTMTVQRTDELDSQVISGTSGTTAKPLSRSGSYRVVYKATDERGRSTSATSDTFSVQVYSPPSISSFTLTRGEGTKSTEVTIVAKGTFSSVGGGNTATLNIQRRSESTWSDVGTNNTSTNGSISRTQPSTGNLETSSYEFKVKITDSFGGSVESLDTVSTQQVVMDIYRNQGVAFGKMYEPDIGGAVQVSGGVYANNRKIINDDGNIEVHDTRFAGTPTDIGLRGVMFEFKSNNTDGLNNGEMYHGVMTFQQWNDDSGGHTHQLGFTANGNLWMRTARIGGSAWGAWKMFANLTDVMDFQKLVRFHSSVDFYGSMFLNNNMALMGKNTSGSNQRMIHIGTDNHLHINADAAGTTFLHTSTLPRTQVYLGTRDYRWLQFNVKGNAKNPSGTSPGSGSSIAMWGSNSIFEMGVGANSNEREGWLQVRHADNEFSTAYGQIKIQPLGGSVYVGGTFSVAGSKNAIHPTRDGFRLTPAYETAESYLGDIGESKTDYTNEVKVYIETLFHDTINTEVPYQVFLQSYGDGFVWVSERNYDHFIVKSSAPNIAFAWELKAKRRGYEEDRMVLSETTFEDAQTMEGLHGGYSTQSKEEEVITKEEGAKI